MNVTAKRLFGIIATVGIIAIVIWYFTGNETKELKGQSSPQCEATTDELSDGIGVIQKLKKQLNSLSKGEKLGLAATGAAIAARTFAIKRDASPNGKTPEDASSPGEIRDIRSETMKIVKEWREEFDKLKLNTQQIESIKKAASYKASEMGANTPKGMEYSVASTMVIAATVPEEDMELWVNEALKFKPEQPLEKAAVKEIQDIVFQAGLAGLQSMEPQKKGYSMFGRKKGYSMFGY